MRVIRFEVRARYLESKRGNSQLRRVTTLNRLGIDIDDDDDDDDDLCYFCMLIDSSQQSYIN